MKKVILISGKATMGKDTTAEYMKECFEGKGYKVAVPHFASHMKNMLRELYGWNGVKDEWARNKLQWMGTEKIRVEMNMPTFHADRTCEQIKITEEDFDFYIIPDWRFPNEFETVVKNFGRENAISIRVSRTNYTSPLTKEQQEHISEISLDGFADYDYMAESEDLKGCRENAEELCEYILEGCD